MPRCVGNNGFCAWRFWLIYYNRKDKYPILALLALFAGALAYGIIYTKHIADFFPLELGALTIPKYLLLSLPALILLVTGFFIYKKKKKWLPAAFGVFILIAVYTFSVDFMFDNILKQHHRDRINLILGKIEDPPGAGYNLFQSKVAIGSGGVWGRDYLQGSQT